MIRTPSQGPLTYRQTLSPFVPPTPDSLGSGKRSLKSWRGSLPMTMDQECP